MAHNRKENPQLPPSNWSRICWQRYRVWKVDANYLTCYLIINDNPLQSDFFSIGHEHCQLPEFPKTIGPTGKTDRESKCPIKLAVLPVHVTDILLLTFLKF
jgi:hypothetical protein